MANDNGWAAVAGQAAQTAGNFAIQAAANKRQFKNQKKAMEIQLQQNKELWDYQNAYNTPQAQMERLRAAGLNPNLIYGNGSGGMGTAGPIQGADVPAERATSASIEENPMSMYLAARQADAQYAATTQNIEMMKKRAALSDVQTGLGTLKMFQEQIKNKNYKDLMSAEVDTKRFIALRAGELFANEKLKGNLMDQLGDLRTKQMTGVDLDNTFKRYRNDLAKLGIYSSDAPAMRILIQASERMGIDLGELIAKGAKQLKYLLD